MNALENRAYQWAHYGGNQGAASPTISAAGVVPYGDISAATNQFMTGQAQMPYLANLPNYAEMLGQQTGNTLSQLKGEVPQDVVTQLQQRGAERGVATGSPGSPNSNAAYLRALGLTSLDIQKQGAANLHQNIADTPVSPLWNPASLFVPEHMAGLELGAASAGLGSGIGTGGGSLRLPGGTLGAGPGQGGGVPSWDKAGPPAVGGTGPFDDLFSSRNFSGGLWTGGGANSTYAPAGGSSFMGNPADAGNQFANDLYSDESNMDWSGYNPFGTGGTGQFDFTDAGTGIGLFDESLVSP